MGPASGVTTKAGNIAATHTKVAAMSDPVRSITNPTSATVANQSPANDTTCAKNSRR